MGESTSVVFLYAIEVINLKLRFKVHIFTSFEFKKVKTFNRYAKEGKQ